MLKDEMWKIFKNSGNINAYIYYSESKKYENENNQEVINKKVKVL